MVGIHPHGVDTAVDEHLQILESKQQFFVFIFVSIFFFFVIGYFFSIEELLTQRDVVVAVGECGLDNSYNNVDFGLQLKWFESQLELAARLSLPAFLHERQAFKPFIEILSKYRNRIPAVVINCFTGTEEELDAYLGMDCYIGITGIICSDDRGTHLRKILRKVPLHRLVSLFVFSFGSFFIWLICLFLFLLFLFLLFFFFF
jgi:Tat protein secretion system quality control protein TatD with DNase activity